VQVSELLDHEVAGQRHVCCFHPQVVARAHRLSDLVELGTMTAPATHKTYGRELGAGCRT